MTYELDIPAAKRPTWRGVTFDSQLECNWYATLTAWNVEFRYHPGQLYLSGGVVYEPDFQLAGDALFEVKGPHDDRIEKVYQAASETNLDVLIGRPPFLPPDPALEVAGAVWDEGERWFLGPDEDGHLMFTDVEDVDVMYSADVAYEHSLPGVRWFVAVDDDYV